MNEVQTSSVPGERPAERSDSFIDDDADFVKLFVGQVSSDNHTPSPQTVLPIATIVSTRLHRINLS